MTSSDEPDPSVMGEEAHTPTNDQVWAVVESASKLADAVIMAVEHNQISNTSDRDAILHLLELAVVTLEKCLDTFPQHVLKQARNPT